LRSFGERFIAEADFGVAVLELFDYVLRHGTTAGDFVEIGGHFAEDVGGSVGEQEDGGFLCWMHCPSPVLLAKYSKN
jgi:hypothetical protein